MRILFNFELSKVVPFIKARNACWGHYVWVNNEDLYNCVAFHFYLHTQSTQTCSSWVEQQVNFYIKYTVW